LNNTSCVHKWKPSGMWNGKTPDGKPTGGVVYECQKCRNKAFGKEEALRKGGKVLEEGLNVFGKPK